MVRPWHNRNSDRENSSISFICVWQFCTMHACSWLSQWHLSFYPNFYKLQYAHVIKLRHHSCVKCVIILLRFSFGFMSFFRYSCWKTGQNFNWKKEAIGTHTKIHIIAKNFRRFMILWSVLLQQGAAECVRERAKNKHKTDAIMHNHHDEQTYEFFAVHWLN